jgi:DNA-binding NarL/FixJ family response regulator
MPCSYGTVLIIDSDPNFSAFASRILGRAGFSTRQAATGNDALDAAREERPGLVVLEVSLPDLSGFEVCRELREQFGDELPIIFVSGERTAPPDRAAGLLMGGDDYLIKPCDPNELLARVRRPMARSWHSPPQIAQSELAHGLTKRELEVLQRLADGLRPAEIAGALFISPKTVASHLQHVLAKLGVHSRAEAVALAYRERLAGGSESEPAGSAGGSGV